MNQKEELKVLEKFRNFATMKGFNVVEGGDWGQKLEDKCYKSIRVAKITSPERIEVLEEGIGIYDLNLIDLKEIDGSLRYQELFKKLYEDKCKKVI